MEDLIKQVQAARKQLGMKPLSNPKKIGEKKLTEQLEKLIAQIEPKQKPKTEEKVKEKTIKEMACELLCEVVAESDEGRTIGMSYQGVLEKILEERPEAKTSLNCLRWYAGKIRVAANGYFKYKMPQLRMRPAKATSAETEEA